MDLSVHRGQGLEVGVGVGVGVGVWEGYLLYKLQGIVVQDMHHPTEYA